jgi:hypothetical protein
MSKAIVVTGTFEDRLGHREYGRVRKVIETPEYGSFAEIFEAIRQVQNYEDLSTDAPFYECEAFCLSIDGIEIIDVPEHGPELYWRWMED